MTEVFKFRVRLLRITTKGGVRLKHFLQQTGGVDLQEFQEKRRRVLDNVLRMWNKGLPTYRTTLN